MTADGSGGGAAGDNGAAADGDTTRRARHWVQVAHSQWRRAAELRIAYTCQTRTLANGSERNGMAPLRQPTTAQRGASSILPYILPLPHLTRAHYHTTTAKFPNHIVGVPPAGSL
jgi:hypothetical protein